MQCVVAFANSLNCEGLLGPYETSEYNVKVLHGVASDCVRVQVSELEGVPRSWAEFFKMNGVDYKGEEDMIGGIWRVEESP